VKDILADGFDTIVALPLAPHYSTMSIGAYYRKLSEALEAAGSDAEVVEVDRWHAHPLFIDAIVERLEEAMQKFSEAERRELKVLFSAHSLPVSIREKGDPYESYLHETAQLAAERIGGIDWSVCYQSAGARSVPWLGPQVEAYIPELAEQGVRSVLVAPIGFVTDHVEVLYDIDIEASEAARDSGVHLERTESMNTLPTFIDMLATVIRERIAVARAATG
jgi:ferrochelatase